MVSSGTRKTVNKQAETSANRSNRGKYQKNEWMKIQKFSIQVPVCVFWDGGLRLVVKVKQTRKERQANGQREREIKGWRDRGRQRHRGTKRKKEADRQTDLLFAG